MIFFQFDCIVHFTYVGMIANASDTPADEDFDHLVHIVATFGTNVVEA